MIKNRRIIVQNNVCVKVAEFPQPYPLTISVAFFVDLGSRPELQITRQLRKLALCDGWRRRLFLSLSCRESSPHEACKGHNGEGDDDGE